MKINGRTAYGIARFNKKNRTVTFECWPRFSDVRHGDGAQFPGWPITVAQDANDGRKVAGYLPELIFANGAKTPVVQIHRGQERRRALHRARPEVAASSRVFIHQWQTHGENWSAETGCQDLSRS